MEIPGIHKDGTVPRTGQLPGGSSIVEEGPTISDSVVLGSAPIGAPARPAVQPASTLNPVLLSASSPAVMANAAAQAVPSGPAAVPLQELLRVLERDHVEFFRKRRFYIPVLMRPAVPIYASDAARLISEGKQVVQAQVNRTTLIANFTEDDARDLAEFKKIDKSAGPHGEIAAFLREAEAAGIEMKSQDGSARGAYGIYKLVTPSAESRGPVVFSIKGVTVATGDLGKDPGKLRVELARWPEIAKTFGNSEHVIAFLQAPLEGAPLEEKAALARGIMSHVKDSCSYDALKNTAKDLERLLAGAKDGKDFLAVGKLYVEMLDAVGSSYWRKDYAEGLDFMSARLKDNPDEFKVFIDLLKSKIDIPTAHAVFTNLPEPVNPGDYEKAAGHFKGSDFWSPERVELAMHPVEGTTLQERIGLIRGIAAHVKDSGSYDVWKNTTKDYGRLREMAGSGKYLLALGGRYVKVLEAANAQYYSKSYIQALDLIGGDLASDQAGFESLVRLVSAYKNVSTAIDAYRLINTPVKGEDHDTRERAVACLTRPDFAKDFAMAARNIPEGETIEDSAKLLAAVISIYGGEKPAEVEHRLRQMQRQKGDLKGSQIADLVARFRFKDDKGLPAVLEFMRKPVRGESFDERRDLFLSMAKARSSYYAPDLKSATSDFSMIADALLEKETLAAGKARFDQIQYAISKSEDAKTIDVSKVARETFQYFSSALKSGAFGEATADDVLAEFSQALVVAGKVKDAVDHVRSKLGVGPDTTIVEGAEDVKVAGVSLKRKKASKNPS